MTLKGNIKRKYPEPITNSIVVKDGKVVKQ